MSYCNVIVYRSQATGQRIGICLQGFGSIGLALIIAMLFEYRVGLVALSFLPVIVFVVYQQVKATRRECYGNAQALENSTKVTLKLTYAYVYYFDNFILIGCGATWEYGIFIAADCNRPS